MPLNRYDSFLKNEFMPDVSSVLMREDNRLRKQIEYSDFKKFYNNKNRGITSYAVTERICQYLIFRSLSSKYRMVLEDLTYPNSSNRIDISIYKTRPKPDQKHGDIGIEIKKGEINTDGILTPTSLANFKSDFDKIKKVKHENKYLMQIIEANTVKSVNEETLQSQVFVKLGNQSTRTYKPQIIYLKKFKTKKKIEDTSHIIITLWKIIKR